MIRTTHDCSDNGRALQCHHARAVARLGALGRQIRHKNLEHGVCRRGVECPRETQQRKVNRRSPVNMAVYARVCEWQNNSSQTYTLSNDFNRLHVLGTDLAQVSIGPPICSSARTFLRHVRHRESHACLTACPAGAARLPLCEARCKAISPSPLRAKPPHSEPQ